MCRVIERPELATDERFAKDEDLIANAADATDILREVFAARPLAEWRVVLDDFSGQWAVVQDTLEAVEDVQAVANGLVQQLEAADGSSFELVAAPVQYDGAPAMPKRAPEFNEHGDRDPRRPRPRHGPDHRPQGAWRRHVMRTSASTCRSTDGWRAARRSPAPRGSPSSGASPTSG